MSVQGSSRQSKEEIQADKNRLLQTICLSILGIFWYLGVLEIGLEMLNL
jgi:hypothetical protein